MSRKKSKETIEPWSEDGGGLESIPSAELARHTRDMFLPSFRARLAEQEEEDASNKRVLEWLTREAECHHDD